MQLISNIKNSNTESQTMLLREIKAPPQKKNKNFLKEEEDVT